MSPRRLARGTQLVALALFASSLAAQGWAPAAPRLTTPWTADVTPGSAWREYPRPHLVRDDWLPLNGLWEYAIRPIGESAPPAAWDGTILVPFCVESSLSGVGRALTPDDALWYRRTLDVPEREGGRWLLHFDAVDWRALVWIDGRLVGEHEGGYDRFTLEAPWALTPGTHELLVRVEDPTDAGTQPRGKQVLRPEGIWYTAVTGIWQSVWMEHVPSAFVRELSVRSDLAHGALVVGLWADGGERSETPLSATVTALVDGRPVASAHGHPDRQEFVLTLPDARPWSPDDPFLYDLEVVLEGGDAPDRVRGYAGLREIALRPDADGVPRLELNGEPIFEFGLLDQGWWPDGLYTAPTDEALRHDIEVSKRLGFNMARKHVKVEPERWYAWCDRLGLLVWQDMPSGDASIWGDMPDIARDEASAAQYERELAALVAGRGSHPSIVMWVPFNEGWGQWDTCRIAGFVKGLDPTRLVDAASGWTDRGCGDVHDVHVYPGPGMPPVESRRAAVLGEFGGLGLPLEGHTWQTRDNWGYRSYDSQDALTDAYVALLAAMRPLVGRGLGAAVYTQTSDVEIEVNGVQTYDRRVVKLDAARAREAARRLFGPPPKVTTLVASSLERPQAWRFTLEAPGAAWTSPDFDDSAWSSGPGGFGTAGTPGARIGSAWSTSDIWLRRAFALDAAAPEGTELLVHHDEDAEVFVDGVRVAAFTGWTTDYVSVPLGPGVRALLGSGEHVLAVHCRQTGGGQFIDVGLLAVEEQDP